MRGVWFVLASTLTHVVDPDGSRLTTPTRVSSTVALLTSRRPGSSSRCGSWSEWPANAARSVDVTASAYSSGVPTA